MRDDDTPCCGSEFWVDLGVSFFLLLLAGLTSGLSMGLLSYSKVDLEVLIKAGLPQDQKNAAKVLPIVKNECFLLCTLLIAKSLATEALPIFLDRILPFWCAIIASVISVVAIVEVIPQAVCSRHGLCLGAKFTLFVRFICFILFPISYPVSKVLDWLLGEDHPSIFRRAELKTLVDLHSVKAGKGGDLTDDETIIISGALDMIQKTAEDSMTPLSKTFSLDINSKLDMQTMKMIASKGHSRIPIYADNPANIVGLILVKLLIFHHPEDETPIKNLTIRRILRVYDDCPLYDVLKLFQEGHGHMAVVVKKSENAAKETSQKTNGDTSLRSITILSDIQHKETNSNGNSPPLTQAEYKNASGVSPRNEAPFHSLDNVTRQGHVFHQFNRLDRGDSNLSNEEIESLKRRHIDETVIGIITMEDVLEELLQEEILDETDPHIDTHSRINVGLLPSRRSSSISVSASASASHGTPATSLSSSYHTPALHSPHSSCAPSPLRRLVLHASPDKPSVGPSRSFCTIHSSRYHRQLSAVSQISRSSDDAF